MSFPLSKKPAIETEPASTEHRRQIALSLAEQCAQVLKQDFQADEVIVFGSLRGDTPWHSDSDIDLAVRGVSADRLLEAYEQLRKMMPAWLPFDLVSVERTDERVRDRILQPTPMPNNIFLDTKVRLEDEVIAISQTIAVLEEVLAQASTTPKILLTPALASYSEDFYSGCERLAERIAVMLDGGLPEGEAWHRALLLQMSKPGGQGRPPLWDGPLLQQLEQQLDRYRSFRHRVRHLYSVQLDDKRVLSMAGLSIGIVGCKRIAVIIYRRTS